MLPLRLGLRNPGEDALRSRSAVGPYPAVRESTRVAKWPAVEANPKAARVVQG